MSILSTFPFYVLANSDALNHLLEHGDAETHWRQWAFRGFVQRDASRPDHVFMQRWKWFCDWGGVKADPFRKNREDIDLPISLALVADGYLERRNGRLYVKTHEAAAESNDAFPHAGGEQEAKFRCSSAFSRWQNIRSRMTTWPVKLWMLYKSGIPADYLLAHPYSALTADFIHQEGLNETHLHLNGYRYPEEEWLQDLYAIPRFRRAESKNYEKKEEVREQYFCVNPHLTPAVLAHRVLVARILRETVILMVSSVSGDIQAHIDRVDETLKRYAATPGYYSLPVTLLSARKSLQERKREEMTMWMKAFALLEPKSGYEQRGVLERYLHLYLLIQNEHIQLNYHAEHRKGFDAFAVSSDHNRLSVGSRAYYEHTFYILLKAAEAGGDTCLEVRVTPQALRRKKQMLLHAYDAAFRKWKRDALREAKMRGIEYSDGKKKPHLILVAHMIKTSIGTRVKEDTANQQLPLYDAARQRHLREAAGIARDARYLMIHHRIPVGIDAANSELNQPPEVFAPAYRLFDVKRCGGHKTYHCGEDFLHLISGIRAVYEAVEFLHLRDGNRIGHGIAVGIHPQQWVKSMPARLVVTRREWMMDMVFAWRLLHETNAAAAVKAEREALALAYLIFSSGAQTNRPGYSIHDLDVLFSLRQFDPRVVRQYLDGSLPRTLYQEGERKSLEEYVKMHGAHALELYWEWNVHSDYRRNQETLMEVKSDFLVIPELLELQQCVQHLIASRDVVIETLPVSNLRISQYRDIQEHHLLRWLKIDGYRVENDANLSICMGSDDPGIFATDIKNEYYHVLMTLRNAGLTEAEAVEKLRTLNRAGRAYSFRELPAMRPSTDSVKSLLSDVPGHTSWSDDLGR